MSRYDCRHDVLLCPARENARADIAALIALLRQHRCNADRTIEGMSVGTCVDRGDCGCSAALLINP